MFLGPRGVHCWEKGEALGGQEVPIGQHHFGHGTKILFFSDFGHFLRLWCCVVVVLCCVLCSCVWCAKP